MRRKILGLLLPIILCISSMPVYAESIDYGEMADLIPGYATAYNLEGTMANGEQTHPGACASSSDRLYAIIILYQRLPDDSVGKFIGQYHCCDTGGNPSIKNGTLIDVWQPTDFDCYEFMDKVYEDGCQGKVWIQVIFGEG